MPMRPVTQAVLLAASCLLLLLVPGCGSHSSAPKRSITSLHMNGVYSTAARELARDFERETGIHVEVVDATLFSLREKALTDLITRAGNYDVMQVAYQWEGEFVPHLRPLDNVVGQIAPDLADFIPTVRTNCGQWGGRTYGLPMACDVITLFYRTDIFEARSAEFQRLTGRPLQPPKTWPEYVEIARFLHSDSLYGNVLMGREQTYTLWSGVLHGMGGRQVDAQWRPVLNSDVGAKSLKLFAEMYQYAQPHSESRFVREADTVFLQGRGAMYMAWPSLMWSQLEDTNRCKIIGKIGAAVIPGGQPQLSAWSLGVNPACNDLDAAYLWIRFFVNQSNTRRLLLRYGKGSPRISTYSDPQCREKIFYFDTLLEGLAGNQPRFRIPPSQELSDYLDNELIKAVRGQLSPEAALERTAARWREILTQSGQLDASAGATRH